MNPIMVAAVLFPMAKDWKLGLEIFYWIVAGGGAAVVVLQLVLLALGHGTWIALLMAALVGGAGVAYAMSVRRARKKMVTVTSSMSSTEEGAR